MVIEDSVAGITAALAAGMRVLGFTGGRHSYPGHGDRLLAAGAESVLTHADQITPERLRVGYNGSGLG